MIWPAVLSCIFALLPALLFLRNLRLYRVLPRTPSLGANFSVLIPARNEEANIGDALHSVLQSDAVEIELIVLDDHSTDRTAEIVRAIAQTDPRVRLETAPPLPAGWFGKNFACHRLAGLARHSLLVFMDADVRVSRPKSLARLAAFVEQSGAALVSGIPREETFGLLEKLIIPLIHFVLLGFLSLDRMRAGTVRALRALAAKSSPSTVTLMSGGRSCGNRGSHARCARACAGLSSARPRRRSVRRDRLLSLPNVPNRRGSVARLREERA